MKNTQFILTCLLLLCSSLLGSVAKAQSEPESASGSLELQSRIGTRVVTVPAHTEVGVKYTVNNRMYHRLTLDAVLDSAVVLSGDTVGVEYLEILSVRKEKQYRQGRTIVLISVIVTVAFYAALALSVLLVFGNGFFSGGLLIGLTVLGILAGLAMPGGLTAGIVLMAMARKAYNLKREYNLRTHPTSKTHDVQ
jgi:hypothetical protein